MRITVFAALLAATIPGSPAHAAAPPQDPMQTLERVLRNYNTLDNDCSEPDTRVPRGHYYCSGVTLRMVNDGPFNPWDYSPFAIKTGATSFSWLRRDLSTRMLIHPGGFILRTPTDAHALGMPAKESGFACVYSFDAASGPERRWHGCGLFDDPAPSRTAQPLVAGRNAALAYGSCAEVGVTDLSSWTQRHAIQVKGTIQREQCSWNAEDPADWDAMIQVHESRVTPTVQHPFAFRAQVTEFMLRNATDHGDGSANAQHIEAFIYDANATHNFPTRGDLAAQRPENGLLSARNFQRKLLAQGHAVPILRLDFNRPAAERFSYVPADQAIALSGSPYFISADWIERHDPGTGRAEWTLRATLTAEGKALQYSEPQRLYDALTSLRSEDPQWRMHERAAGSMRQQMACLVRNHPAKTEWNLEPFRPVVSLAEAARTGCNPLPKLRAERYIASSRWLLRADPGTGREEWSLLVTPDRQTRVLPAPQWSAVYEELAALRGRDPQWRQGEQSPGSMRAQLQCLLENYPDKADWHLEPFRPLADPARMRAAGCNPVPG